MDPSRTLFLVDGHALAYRAYFAFVRNPLLNSRGENTSAAFGFTRMLLQLIDKYNPRLLAVVFDSGEETARHREYKEYKAKRPAMPRDMIKQLPWIFEIVEALGVRKILEPGVEADDLIATLARRAAEKGLDAVVVTADKDLLQLLSDRIRIIRPEKGTGLEEQVGPEFCKKRWGIYPSQVVDLLALMGDASDGIPGIRGIGEKTAVKLLEKFGSLEELFARLEEVEPESLRGKIAAGKEAAIMSRELVALRDIPIALDPLSLTIGKRDDRRLEELLLQLEFHRILKDLSLESGRDRIQRDYRLVGDCDLSYVAETLSASSEIAIDTETTSVEPMSAGLVGISFSIGPGRAWYVPVKVPSGRGEPEQGEKFEWCGDSRSSELGLFSTEASNEERSVCERREDAPAAVDIGRVRKILGPVLANENIAKIGHNIKYDLIVLERHGLPVRGVKFDTMIASYVLDPERRSHSLDNLAMEFIRSRKIAFEDLFPSKSRRKDIRTVPIDKLAEYSCEDADYTIRLKRIFADKLSSLGFDRLFREIEMPLCLVLSRMEREGVSIDSAALGELSIRLGEDLERLEKMITESAGEKFNINSSRQLQKILFDKLRLRAGRRTKTGFSTDEEVLAELSTSHQIAALILEYRQLSKLKSTYVETLPRLVNPQTGRIHTSFNQTVTATGRLSSSDPNLQNIPIRTEVGRAIRSAFVPRRGNMLMDADYSQIELRILAHLSRDPGFIEAFKEGKDIHVRTAARIFDVPEEAVSPEMRSRAKTINFGVIYGMGPRGLSRQLDIPVDEAKRFIDEYFERYPGVKSFIESAVAEGRRRRYAETLLGRRRFLPDIDSDDGMLRSFSERIAINTPIQGTAADMIKIAMIAIDADIISCGLRSRMILQVHDELVFDLVPEERDQLVEIVRTRMERALILDVPVRVDIGVGANWLEAHP